jgi:membrane protease subunit HflK
MSNSGGPSPWGSPGGSSGGSGGGQRPPGGGGPWGGGPGGPFGGRPGGPGPLPDLDAVIARIQAYIRSLLGGRGPRGGFTGGRGLALIGLAVVALWLASGVYRVQPDELGVVMRFGAFNRITQPGLNWHYPWPIEHVLLPAVTRINRTEIGFRSGAAQTEVTGGEPGGRDMPNESLMLTGDENIIDINLTVFWKIKQNPADYLFSTRDPDNLVKAIAESSIREVIGRTPIQPALTQLRAQIETDVHNQTQQILDRYHAGIDVTQVQLQRVDPPDAVIESFRDVQRANTDAERMRNEAQAYANDIVPRARGDAARTIAEGQGAKQASIAQATGQTQRFLSVFAQYQQAKDVTLRRMYIETMQDILTRSPTLVVDDKLKGLVPFLPLSLPAPGAPRPAVPSNSPSTAASPGPSQGQPGASR